MNKNIIDSGFNRVIKLRKGFIVYNKNNYLKDDENIFGNIVSVNMLCLHNDSLINIIDMDEVVDSNYHPMKK